MVKLALWVLLGLSVAGLAFWFMATPGGPRNPLQLLLVVMVFGVAPVGTFWMMYVSIRHEKHPLPLVFLAFVLPYSFLWYYFERVRPGEHKSRLEASGGEERQL